MRSMRESTTFSTLIHGVYPSSEVKFGTILSKNNAFLQLTGTEFLTKLILLVNYVFIILSMFFYLLGLRGIGLFMMS